MKSQAYRTAFRSGEAVSAAHRRTALRALVAALAMPARLIGAFSAVRVGPQAMAQESQERDSEGGSGAATVEPEQAPAPAKPRGTTKPKPKKPPAKQLPPWKVLLHNDDVNTFEHVTLTILELTPLSEQQALKATIEAHRQGTALLLVTHKERAELFVEQFHSKLLTVTTEPAE